MCVAADRPAAWVRPRATTTVKGLPDCRRRVPERGASTHGCGQSGAARRRSAPAPQHPGERCARPGNRKAQCVPAPRRSPPPPRGVGGRQRDARRLDASCPLVYDCGLRRAKGASQCPAHEADGVAAILAPGDSRDWLDGNSPTRLCSAAAGETTSSRKRSAAPVSGLSLNVASRGVQSFPFAAASRRV
jgi:hypothetical protein